MGIGTEDLERRVRVCTLCRLNKSRKNAVPGEGPYNANLVFVGEGPGRNEDIQGRPFIGSAGKFLEELLKTAGLKREEVYITNVVKCRPPSNRVPQDDEIETCTSNYLKKQIAMIKPKFVVSLGRTAARAMLGRTIVMSEEHGKKSRINYGGTNFTIFFTYHPAAALYDGEARNKLLRDFEKLGQILSEI